MMIVRWYGVDGGGVPWYSGALVMVLTVSWCKGCVSGCLGMCLCQWWWWW